MESFQEMKNFLETIKWKQLNGIERKKVYQNEAKIIK